MLIGAHHRRELPHHLPEAVAALEIKMSEEERQYLEEPYVPHLV